jgi:hypothetical protein
VAVADFDCGAALPDDAADLLVIIADDDKMIFV